jgi:large subunit ribosomal protein L24
MNKNLFYEQNINSYSLFIIEKEMSKLHIKKGDSVIVIAGNSKSDKQRRVLAVYPDKQRALVEGVNMVSKSTKPTSKHPNGGVIKKEAPIHISNLNVADPKTGKPTRIGRKLNAEGKLVRYSKKSGEEIK